MDETTTTRAKWLEELETTHEAAFAWAMTCTKYRRDEAEEVLQTVYLKVLSGKAVFGERSTFRTWLFGVVRLTAKERARKSAIRRALLLKFTPEPIVWRLPDETAEASEQKRTVLEAISKLSDRQREVVDLVFYHDLTIEEASNVMEIGVGSARTHYARAKEKLAEYLEAERER